jgi:hypothetical protein
MNDEETTLASESLNPAPAQPEAEPKAGAPVMLLVIIGSVFAALILFGVLVR